MSRLKSLHFNKKRIGLLISIYIMFVGLFPHLILIPISGSNYSYTVDPISLESEDGTYISAFQYTPKVEKNHGGIVIGHHLTGNKFYAHPLSIELVKRGFTVINIDFRGHGASSGFLLDRELPNDMIAAINYFEYSLTYISEIGLVGHSIGGATALLLASSYPNKINATVAIGTLPTNISRISNLLMAIGRYEPLVSKEDLLDALKLYTGRQNVIIGETYDGDFVGGKNIRCFIGSYSEHIFETMDPSIIYETVQWFEQAFNGEVASDIFITAPIYQIFSYISLFGLIILILILIVYLSYYFFDGKIVYPEKELIKEDGGISKNNLIKYYAIYVMTIGFFIFIILSDNLTAVVPLYTASLIFSLTIGTTIGTIIIYNLLVLNKLEKLTIKGLPLKIKKLISTNSGRSLLFGIIASLLLISALSVAWHWNPQNILPTTGEIGIMIGITLVSFPFFLIKELYFRTVQGTLKCSNRIREYINMVAIGIFMENFLIGIIKLIGWIHLVEMPGNMHYLLVWIIFSIIQQFLVTWVYMWSGRNIIGSTIFSCIFYAWISVIFLPSLGFL